MPGEQHQPSVADLMRPDRTLAEHHLIKPAWSSQNVLRPSHKGPARPH